MPTIDQILAAWFASQPPSEGFCAALEFLATGDRSGLATARWDKAAYTVTTDEAREAGSAPGGSGRLAVTREP